MRRAIVIVGLMLFAPLLLRAEDFIWIALIKADARPTEEARLLQWQSRLKPVFGYEGYHLLYETRVSCGERYEQWALPRKDFYLKVEPFCQSSTGKTGVFFEVYKDKKMLVSGCFHPVNSRPLFINGPDYLDGKLVFLMQVVPEEPTHSAQPIR